jgi:hypothetical protein
MRTAFGRDGGPWPSLNKISWMISIEPFTNPASVYKLALSIMCAPLVSSRRASRPFAILESALDASRPVFTAWILAM